MAGTPTTVAAPEVGQGSWRPGSDARPWIRFCLAAHLRQARTTLRLAEESEDLWLRCEQEHETEGHGLSPRIASTLFDAALGFRIRNPTHRAAVLILTGVSIQSRTAVAGRWSTAPGGAGSPRRGRP